MLRSIGLTLALALLSASIAQAQNASPLATAWQELLSADDAKATKAALAFAAKPKESVEFLTAALKPLKAEPKLLAKLFGDLGDKDYKTREAAQVELEYFGKFIKTDLEKAAKDESNPEAKERLGKLLGRIDAAEKEEKIKIAKPEAANPQGGRGSVSVGNVNGRVTILIDGKVIDTTPKLVEKLPPPPTWTRAGRAIGILEFLGTPDAVKLLEALSLGEDTAAPTKQAQDALARLRRKK